MIADRLDQTLQPPGAGAAHGRESRRGKLHAEQIGHEGDEARFGQQLIVQQIDHEGVLQMEGLSRPRQGAPGMLPMPVRLPLHRPDAG